MAEWIKFINALGKTQTSKEVKQLCLLINEVADISSDPIEFNDALGRTTYYAFVLSGIEIGFRENVLNHVHFYFNDDDGYGRYKDKLISDIGAGWNKKDVIRALGEPLQEGGGNVDMLLGNIDLWIKYQYQNYDLNFQFKLDNTLSRCSLILR